MNQQIDVFDIANELIIIPKAVIDKFLKYKNPSELISLYSFYYYTAKWQKTNQPKCSTNYVAKGLHWHKDKVIKIKKQLKEIGLIKDIKNIDPETHKIKGWYIKLNYIFKRETVNNTIENHTPSFPEGGNSQWVDFEDINALSSNNINALNSNNNIPDESGNNPIIIIEKYYHSLINKYIPSYDVTKDYIYNKNRGIIKKLLQRAGGTDKLKDIIDRYMKTEGKKTSYALQSLQQDWVWNKLINQKSYAEKAWEQIIAESKNGR